jgi:hypothetical protein
LTGRVKNGLLPKYLFRLPESVLNKSKARFRRLQNSPSAQTLVIAYLALRQDLFAKTLSMAAQTDIIWATGRKRLDRLWCLLKPEIKLSLT